MNYNKTEEIACRLLRLYKENCSVPFPYEGSRKLLHAANQQYQGFIPDLDLYFSAIAGYCSWGKRIMKWNAEKIEAVTADLGKSFFEKHPQYKPMEPLVNEKNTPDLYRSMIVYETMRVELLKLLSHLN